MVPIQRGFLPVLAACFAGVAALLATAPAVATESSHAYSPHAGEIFPRRVYWGDTHLHSSYSFDAYPAGNDSIGPDEAFRFARGEEVTSAGIGQRVRLRRPLDWLVVSDHAEYLGMTKALLEGSAALRADPDGARLYDLAQGGQTIDAVMALGNSVVEGNELLEDMAVKQDIWSRATAIADRHDDPGRFTAFIGFEWTSMPGTGDNLHRVVIYRDGAELARTRLPFSAFDSEDPEDLWRWMAEYESISGGAVLAIPHNGNASNGLMFSDRTLGGEPLTSEYALQRARWEPLYEVTQIKGDSEAHPALSPADPFADFETWDRGNIAANAPKEEWMLRYEYARSALKLGLGHERRIGANPFKFGLIGSTDSHTGLSTADDDNFWGKLSSVEPTPKRLTDNFYGGRAFDVPTRVTSASGYTGVWARENTRASLFDAFRRREVYATTGPRMTLRFFAGWRFRPDHAHVPDVARTGYALGVPMGADLPSLPAGERVAPTFLLSALKDPDGANLDRIQIVKGWLDKDGGLHERVFDVAWSGKRKPGPDNALPPIGSTVDPGTASYRNTIGAVRLTSVWTDPDFRPDEPAFYYARALEIPTPRWTTYDAARFGRPLPPDVPPALQQRAYTSPVWYRP